MQNMNLGQTNILETLFNVSIRVVLKFNVTVGYTRFDNSYIKNSN